MANAKSASPEARPRISRARHKLRTSICSRTPPYAAGTQARNNPAAITDAQEQLASAQNNLQMAQSFDPEKAGPTVTYDGELMFHMGGEEIHVYHPARAHTDGDSIVYFKNANVAHWGDGFANNWVPVIDAAANGSSLEWLQFIDKGIQLVGENATMVPGHDSMNASAATMVAQW